MSKLVKIIIFVSLFSFNFLFSETAQSDPDSNIVIEISLDKSTYVVGENIFLDVKYKNIGNETDSFATLTEQDMLLMINLIKPDGGKAEYVGIWVCGFPHISYFKLLPDEEKVYEANLFYAYGIQSEHSKPFGHQYYFPVGKYSVSTYNNKDKFYIKSNDIAFEVVDPTEEQLSQLTELRTIYKMDTKGESNKKAKIKAYRDFQAKYPNSIYFQEAYYYFMIMKCMCNMLDENTIMESLYFVERFPNSHNSSSVIWSGMEASFQFRGKSETRKFLINIEQKYPNTRASNSIKEIISSGYYQQKANQD